MATNPPRWSPGPHNLLALAATICLILAAFAFHGSDVGLGGQAWACAGFACFFAQGIAE